jgi:hypothetical protein
MSYFIKSEGVSINRSFDTLEEAFSSGKKLNIPFAVHKSNDGIVEVYPVATYNPPPDNISESVFLAE